MTTKTIGQLPALTTLTPDTMFEVETNGVSKKIAWADLVTGSTADYEAPGLASVIDQVAAVKELVDSLADTFDNSVQPASESATLADQSRLAAVAARGVAEQAVVYADQAKQAASDFRDRAGQASQDAAGFRDQAQNILDNAESSLIAIIDQKIDEVEVHVTNQPNLLAYGSFEGGPAQGWSGINEAGLSVFVHPELGSICYGVPSVATGTIASTAFALEAGAQVTLSADTQLIADSGICYVDMLFYDSSNGLLLDGDQNFRAASHVFSDDGAGQIATAKTYISPPSTAKAVVRFVWDTLVNYSNGVGVRRIKLERGAKWSSYTQEGVTQNLAARVTTIETAVTDGRFAAASRVSVLEAQLAGSSGSNLSARLGTVETAVTDGRFAAASRASTLEAQMTGLTDSGLKSKIADTATAAASATQAVADRTSTLEASSTADGVYQNANPRQSVWPDGQELPSGWSRWIWGGSVARVARPNAEGGYSTRMAHNGSDSFGHVETITLAAGWYVLEADVSFVSGSTWEGSGLTVSGIYTIDFASDTDTTKNASASPSYNGGKRRFSKLIYVSTTQAYNFHAMTFWDALSLTRNPRTIDWNFAGVRFASDGEIKAKTADDTLFGAGGVLARLTNTETAVTDGRFAAASRASTLEAQMAGSGDSWLKGQISDNAIAAASDTQAVADRASTLEARSSSSGNWLANTTFLTTAGWTLGWTGVNRLETGINVAGDDWHPIGENVIALRQGSADNSSNEFTQGYDWYSVEVPVVALSWIQFYAFTASHRASNQVIAQFLDTNGAATGIENSPASAGADDGYSGGKNITNYHQTGRTSVQVPAGSATVRLFLRKWDTRGANTDSYGWFARPYVGAARPGQTEWNGYAPGSGSSDTTNLLARVTTTETAVTDGRFAAASRASTLEAQLAGSQPSGLGSRLSTVETATTDGRFASASRASTLEAQMAGTQGSNLNSRIATVETATTDGRFATSSRVSALEASSTADGNYQNANPRQSIWPDGQALPTGWSYWFLDGSVQRITRPVQEGGYSARFIYPGGGNLGHYETITLAAGWYVMEADVTIVTGSTWEGSGLTLSGAYNLDFARENDTTTTTTTDPNYATGRRRFSKLLYLPNSQVWNWHAMTYWDTLSSGAAARTIDWNFAGIRPASDGEIKAKNADNTLFGAGGVIARLSTVETATTDGRFASASRASTLEAQMSSAQSSGLGSRISTVETAVTDGRFASASRASTLEAQMAGSQGSGLYNAIVAYADSAVAGEAGARASAIQNISVNYKGSNLSLQQLSGVVAGVDNNQAVIWQVTETLGDGTAKIALVNTKGGGSQFLVDAANAYFSGNILVAGSVSTGKVAPNAISQVYYVTNDGPCRYYPGGNIYDDDGNIIDTTPDYYTNVWDGSGNYVSQGPEGRIMRIPFHTDYEADVIVFLKWTQGYYASPQPFHCALYINGQQRDYIGSGGTYADNPNMQGGLRVSAGDGYFDVIWSPSVNSIAAGQIHATLFIIKR